MRIVAFAASVLLGCAPAWAQSPEHGAASVPPQFEVASIKQAFFPNDMFFAGFVAAGGTCAPARADIAGERVAFRRATLCGLMRFALTSGTIRSSTGRPG